MTRDAMAFALCGLLLAPALNEHGEAPGGAPPESDWVVVSGDESVRRERAAVGSQIEVRREVTNRSDRTARIRLIRSSCPCVTIEIEPVQAGPGESATITARTHVSAVAEPQMHWAIVEVARLDENGLALDSRQVRLNLEYTADLSLLVEPARAWFVGTIGVPEHRTFYIRSSGLDAVGFKGLCAEGNGFAIDGVRRFRSMPENRAPEDVLAVTVAYTGQTTEVVMGAVRFATDLPGMQDVRLPLEARAVARWRARPAGFALLHDGHGVCETAAEILTREGRSCPARRADVVCEEGRTLGDAVRARVLPPDSHGNVRVTLALHTDELPDHGRANVRLFDAEGRVVHVLPLAWVRRVGHDE